MTSIRVLVIDDEKDFADQLMNYFKMLGYGVFVAYSGEDGLDILRKEKPEVLLCDLKMQGALHGDDVLTHLKSISPKTIPIMITAFKDEATKKKLTEKGATRVLFKPVQLSDLEDLLEGIEEDIIDG